MKSLLSYFQSNHCFDYQKILHDAKALKTLHPQVLCELQNMLGHAGQENMAFENQENTMISEKLMAETNSETEAHNKSNSMSVTPLENMAEKTPNKENQGEAKKKTWTPKEVKFLKNR